MSMLADIMRRLELKRAEYERLRTTGASDYLFSAPPNNGTMAGVLVDDALRDRIESVRRKWELKSYRHAIFACIRAGVSVLE